MKITVKLFAMIRDVVGTSEILLEVERHSTVSDLIDLLSKQAPKLNNWRQYVRVAVNREYVSIDHVLSENDEVAFIPPVSGG